MIIPERRLSMSTPPSHLPNQKQDTYAYIQVSMGMIHPDYVYINHFLHEHNEENFKHEENLSEEEMEISISSVKSLNANPKETKVEKVMQVHFHSRKDIR